MLNNKESMNKMDQQCKEMINDIKNSNNNPILVQLPSTLPFEIKENSDSQLHDLSKIGKLLVKKSGKMIMRIYDEKNQTSTGKKYIDLEVNQGINAMFYQELSYMKNEKNETR